MSIQMEAGVPSASTIRTFRVPSDECEHESIRYPQRLPRVPGQDIFCPDCGMERARPKWMDRFTPEELRTLQGLAEIAAVWVDYADPDPERRISQRTAYQRIVALIEIHQLSGRETYIQDIFNRMQRYV